MHHVVQARNTSLNLPCPVVFPMRSFIGIYWASVITWFMFPIGWLLLHVYPTEPQWGEGLTMVANVASKVS